MLIVRPVGALAKRMNVKLRENSSESTGILGDWFAQGMVLDRQQLILCVSKNGRLPVLMHAAPYASFPERFAEELKSVLLNLRISPEKVDAELSQMTPVILAKTNDRSILGSMKEFKNILTAPGSSRSDHFDPLLMSLFLADTISLVLPDLTPKDSVLKLFGEPVSSTKKPNLTLVSSKD